jgi:hypothetical protein
MMLLCPRCGDYYADGSLAFCLADGTPLVSVNPGSDKWSEGARIIEQKDQALKKQKRRKQWWRVSSVMTMLIVTMAVYGVVAKRYVYLVPAASPTPTPLSSPSPSSSTSPSTTPSPSPLPTTTIVIKETPTPTPKMCSDADERREEQIIRSYLPAWRQNIQGERAKVVAENVPDGARNAEAILGGIELQVTFVIPCKSAAITARYGWQVSFSLNGAPPKTKTVSRKRTIGCGKAFGIWVCR